MMIRQLQPADFNKLLEIETQAFPKSQYSRLELQSLYLRYPETFLVEESVQIDGYIVFSPDGHIISMAVRSQRRRRGIGTRLVREAIAYCGGKSLRLEVRAGNLVAQEFYENLGFRKQARLQGYYQDGEDGLLMERPADDGEEIPRTY
jgi:ribosomal-protein-alanine N-acetyltransferase